MKCNKHHIIIISVSLVLSVLCDATIGQSTNLPSAAHHYRTRASTDVLKRALDLTDEQAEKLEPVVRENREKVLNLRNDSLLSRRERRAKMREVRESMDTKIKSHLTPDQAEKWQNRLRAAGPGEKVKKADQKKKAERTEQATNAQPSQVQGGRADEEQKGKNASSSASTNSVSNKSHGKNYAN